MKDERFQKTELAVWGGIAGNAALACLKGIVGIMAQSSALLADAAHSASRAIASSAALIRVRSDQQPPEELDAQSPEKNMSIASILLAIVVLIIGIEMGISAIHALGSAEEHTDKNYALAALGLSLVVKEIMYQYVSRLGKRIGSQELIANSRGHRSDIYSTIVALIGVFGATLSNVLQVPFLSYLDPITGIIISLMILKMGYSLVKEALHRKQEYVLQQEDADDLIAVVQLIKGVITVDDLRAREHGHYVVVTVKISVNPRVTVWEGHEVSKRIKQQLMKRFHHVSDVFVHVAPYDAGYPYKHSTDSELSELPSVIH
ncbi:cation transporter [Paenibacillus sp. CGMCC 1.16610]|uniref:Cation diffusion facilitator family transporter n=1 Tax=Paenibacillus anseongense TaxID=2682845 RepID=A0ABW9U547_9BACL|nr:cation diffusion facilitator family transporter [Paenibacillus sp. CGMCC 1.16610]MBA2939263.1 cation transporter [Paenibacillus sp. CGMCC 1.16610]MVQ35222.1 cation diffusion facilitator family transporter [Paenibacillus anseongense]